MKFTGVTIQVAQTNQSTAINFPNMPIVAKKNDWQIAHSNEKPIVFGSSKVQSNIGEMQDDGFISSLGKLWQRFSSGAADDTVSRARRDTALEQSQSIRQLLHGAGIPPERQAKLVNYLNFGLSLSDASDPVYYDGMTMHGLEGKSLSEALRQAQGKIERLLMFFARNNDDFLWIPNNKEVELLSGFLTANLTDFSFEGLGESDIKYGSKEWAQLRLGLQSLKDQGIDPRTYSEHQLLLMVDTALRTDNTKNKAQLLYLLAGASGRLDLGNLNQKTPQEIKDALTATFKEKFSEELKKTAALAKVAEYHNSLTTISNNIPTLPAEHTMDEYNDYAARYLRYRNDFTMTLGRLLDAKIDLLPAWAQEKIQRGKVSIIKPQLSIKYSQNGVETLSNKYKYDLPGSFPLILQINQEGLNRFFVFSMNTMEPQMIPDKVKPKNWLNQHQTDIVSPEWAREKTDESISNEVRSNIANRREMPEGKNIDVTPFLVTSTENPRTYQQIKLDILNKVGQTIDQNRIKTFDERASDTYVNIFKPIVELIPRAQALASFAEGDVKNALISLGLDIIGAGIAGIEIKALATAVSKGAGYLEKTISDSMAEMVINNKVLISGLEKEAFKVPNQGARLTVPAEFENVQIGETRSWTHPSTGEPLIVTRLADTDDIVALKPGMGGPDTARVIAPNTGRITGELAYKEKGIWSRGGLKGGALQSPLGLQYSSKDEANAHFQKMTKIEGMFTGAERAPAAKREPILNNLTQQLQALFPGQNLSSLTIDQLKANYLPQIQAEKQVASAMRAQFESQVTTAAAQAQTNAASQLAAQRALDNPTAQQQVNLAKLHLVNDPKLISDTSMDIMGTHNQINFNNKINRINDPTKRTEIAALGIVPGSAQINSITPHSNRAADGIYNIKYEYKYYPKDSSGMPVTTSPQRIHGGIKTVYDPQKISDADIEQLGIRGFTEVQKARLGTPSTAQTIQQGRQYRVTVDPGKNLEMDFWVDPHGNLDSFYPIT